MNLFIFSNSTAYFTYHQV